MVEEKLYSSWEEVDHSNHPGAGGMGVNPT